MADAKGAFVTRALEKLLKDSAGRKYTSLQKACKGYLERPRPKAAPASPAATSGAPPPDSQKEPPAEAPPQIPEELHDVSLASPRTPVAGTPGTKTPSAPASPAATSPPGSPGPAAGAARTMAEAGMQLTEKDAELVLLPLKLACESKQPKLVETALDCLHKLIAYGHLEGEAGLEAGGNSKMNTELFQMVCASADVPNDSVVLQVIKVLLTAVASSTFKVHGECLLLAIRTCYNIALGSKSPINQATAKATLTQMINLVFQRMDPEYKEAGPPSRHMSPVPSPRPPSSPRGAHPHPPTLHLDEKKHLPHEKTAEGDSVAKETQNGGLEKEAASPPPTPGPAPVQVASSEASPSDAAPSSPAAPASPSAAVSIEELAHLAGDADIKGLEAALDKAVHPDGVPAGQHGPEGAGPLDQHSLTQAERNALMVFRTLCKLSMAEPKSPSEADIITRGRLLSLELLQALLENAGKGFAIVPCFLEALQSYLPYALLRASVTPLAAVFERAASLFAVLLLNFRHHLKAEIGIFFPLIVLRSLDLPDSPLHQRVAVLKSLQTAFADPQTVLDFFVNYDCDLDSTNLFERAVKSLSRIAQGAPGSDPGSIALAQNTGLKASSLQVLANILQSLLTWTKRGQAASVAVAAAAAEDSERAEGEDNDDSSVAAQLVKDKTQKSLIEAAVVEFNLKPEKGIKQLEKQGILAHEPVAIAKFLHGTPGLNKTLIGEYLGHHEEFHIKVMHAYVDELSFTGLIFDDAIRRFLSGFRLPGEAQKIDRLMEKFAERYCKDNPGTFKNADTAYVLAYAVIMLNTDAHNPMVWPKMSKTDFVRINSNTGQPGAEDTSAPVALLEDLYDRIVNNEIKLKDESAAPGAASKSPVSAGPLGVLNLALPRGRAASAEATGEGDEIVRRTQALFKTQQHGKVFQKATEVGLARPILEAVGWPLLAAFSVIMEDSDYKPHVALCMEGFRLGVQLTRVLRMETMRNAFLTSMVRLTSLHAPREMRTKNVEALRVLLQMAQQEPDVLQDAWYSALECISRLEEIANTPAAQAALLPGGNQPSREALVHGIQELAGMPTEGVFVNSNRLPSDAVVEFFTALCRVSEGELGITPPRVFSLQKLVEISYYNITRIRLVWARIWAVLSVHFIAAGEHADEQVAMYAIDSLRQLAMKYLERAELANFTFQNDIMKPFVVIMRGSRSERIRELITQCVVQMIKSKVSGIKSGWKSVFMVFTTAAQDTSESIVDSAFLNVEQVVLEHFDQVVGDCFMDCVNCLIAFANNKLSAGISLKAIALLRICEDRLAEGHIPGGSHRPVEDTPKKSDKEVAEFYWFPMLAGLSELTSDPRPDVRSCALEVLFDLLNERGASFSPTFWESVFQRVLFPIFDYVRHAGAAGHKRLSANEWLRDTCIHCLQLLCDLFSKFYADVSFLLPSLLGLLLDCATRPDQALAAISVAALVRLMDIGGHALSESDWGRLLNTIRDMSDATRPVELLNPESLGVFGTSPAALEGSASRRQSIGDGQVTPVRLSTVEEPRRGPRLERVAENGSFKGEQGTVSLPGEPSAGPPPSADGGAGTSEDGAQSAAQTMVGRMMSTLLMRNMSFTRKGRADPQVVAPRAPPDEGGTYLDTLGPEDAIEFTNETLDAVRCKCVIQLLLLDALSKAQSEHWANLSPTNKRALLETMQGLVDFAAKYNSDVSLRQRLQSVGSENPPPSLLRQEVDGTGLYLAVLFSVLDDKDSDAPLLADAEARFVGVAERVLGEASALQSDRADSTRSHQALGLKAPVTVKVLDALQTVSEPVFKRHFEQLYPHLTTLIGSDQLEVRRALANLFSARLGALLPATK